MDANTNICTYLSQIAGVAHHFNIDYITGKLLTMKERGESGEIKITNIVEQSRRERKKAELVEVRQNERIHRAESGAAAERPSSKCEIFSKSLEHLPISCANTSEGSCKRLSAGLC